MSVRPSLDRVELPFEVTHDPGRIRRGMAAALTMVLIGIAFPIVAAGLSRVPLSEHILLLVGVSGGFILMGGALALMGWVRLRDRFYLTVSKDGVGRWRPLVRSLKCQFSLENPVVEERKLFWTKRPEGCVVGVSPDGRFYIDLPESVVITGHSI